MNPWQWNVFDGFRNTMRLVLWACLFLVGLMSAIFAIAFSYHFLIHLWRWCSRVLFSSDW